MSWLARSIANTLLIDDDDHPLPGHTSDHHHNPQFSPQPLHIHHQIQNTEIQNTEIQHHDPSASVKEDLSEFTESLTRQLWGVASFLAPPPPPPPPPPIHHDSTANSRPDLSVSGCEDGDPYLDDDRVSDSAYDGSRFGVDYADSGNLSSSPSDRSESVEAVGVREEALAFARNIAHHPETWLDFPLSEEEDDDDFEMSDIQWNHVTVVERLAPRLAALRIELCPVHMSESYFWKVYFVLLHPRLNKHDADLLSTPQIVAARSMWMKELQKRTNPKLESPDTDTSQSHGGNPLQHDFNTSSQQPSANTSFEPAKYPFEKSASQEVASTKTSFDYTTPRSFTIPLQVDDDDDDWILQNPELNGYVGPDVQYGTDEDISFSDLEADDDCTMPIRSKIL